MLLGSVAAAVSAVRPFTLRLPGILQRHRDPSHKRGPESQSAQHLSLYGRERLYEPFCSLKLTFISVIRDMLSAC
jgi:hypothetical protein